MTTILPPRPVSDGSARDLGVAEVRTGPTLAVLLATRNGGRFIDEQLQSVISQDWPSIDVWASDDGSTDDTREALADWASEWSKGSFALLEGPRGGFAANFRSLLANPAIGGDLVAFCDQDDIWLADKTRAAAEALAPHGDRPALYCTSTIVSDATGAPLYTSPKFRRPATFRNAMVQSIGGGNTMVLNRAAHELLREGARRTDFVSHDWFAYLLVTGAGGVVVYSSEPRVRYRQHGGNLVGSNKGIAASVERLVSAFRGRFTDWNDRNLAALAACRPLLTPDAIETIDRFTLARSRGMLAGTLELARSGVYRQTPFGQLSLYAACVLGKL